MRGFFLWLCLSVTWLVTLTLYAWVSPVELLTLSALLAPETWTTVTLACELQRTERKREREKDSFFICIFSLEIASWSLSPAPVLPHHVAVSSHGMLQVAATGLTAPLLTIVPVVGSTLVAVMASNVGSTQAGPGLPVTIALLVTAGRLDGASSHTGTAWNQTQVEDSKALLSAPLASQQKKTEVFAAIFGGRRSLWTGKMLWNNLVVHQLQLLTVVSHFISKIITGKKIKF